MLDPLLSHASRHRRLSVLLAVVAAAGVMAVGELSYQLAEDSLHGLRASHEARRDATALRSLLADAEVAQRGYLITGRDADMAALKGAERALPELLDRLDKRYTDPEGARLLAQLSTAAKARLDELHAGIQQYQEGAHGTWRARMALGVGDDTVAAVREATAALDVHETGSIGMDRVAVFRALSIGRFGVHALTVFSLLWLLYFLRKNEVLLQVRSSHAQQLRHERDLLEGEVRHRTAELTDLAQHLTRVREDERAHMAREMHDELGALLTAAKMDVARIRRLVAKGAWGDIDERMSHMSGLLDEGIVLKRRIIEDLRPSALSNLGLTATLEILVREVADRSGLTLHAQVSEVAIDASDQLAIYRLVQESLVNVCRHAQAKTVWLRLGVDGEQLVLSIRDDGAGFDPAQVPPGSHGLIGMRYRMESLGGTLRLSAAPGQGTEVEARLPLRPAAPAVAASGSAAAA